MATAAQVVKAGLQSIIVQASESEINASDAQDFIFAMNNYAFDLAANNINLGYTEITNLGDEVTVAPGALRGLIANVAIEVAPQYGGIVSSELIGIANAGYKTLLQIGTTIVPSSYPSTLPIGAGNEGEGTFRTRHFYPGTEAEILAEISGAIGLESETEES